MKSRLKKLKGEFILSGLLKKADTRTIKAQEAYDLTSNTIGVSHNVKRMIIEIINEAGNICVNDIMIESRNRQRKSDAPSWLKSFNIIQPSISRHLADLRSCSFVFYEKKGKSNVYEVDFETYLATLDLIESLTLHIETIDTDDRFKVICKTAKQILRVFINDRRIEMLQLIHDEGRIKPFEIETIMKLDQTVVSQQLKILRDAGVVIVKKDGWYRWYSSTTRSRIIHEKDSVKKRLISLETIHEAIFNYYAVEILPI